MGVMQSQELREQYKLSRKIEKSLKVENSVVVKLLLLGAGESGKSTILKQLRLLHDPGGFSEEDRKVMATQVYSNTVVNMAAILSAMQKMQISFEDDEIESDARLIFHVISAGEDGMPLTGATTAALRALWGDKGIRRCYDRRAEFQLDDCAKYFFDSLDRISQPAFIPSVQDVLNMRAATLGAVEVKFTFKDALFRVFDVGGQKSQRRKWIHFFDDMSAVIFVAASSEYDQTLREDHSINRMHDTLELFDAISNSEWFVKPSMILFLNKTDLFLEKIDRVPITTAFPHYTGAQTMEASMKFIEGEFCARCQDPAKKIFRHRTCATNTDQVQLVLNDVIGMLVASNTMGVM